MLRTVLALLALALPTAGYEGESQLEGFEIVSLEAHPTEVLLERSVDQVQLLLTALASDGSRIDVTREATLVAFPRLTCTPQVVAMSWRSRQALRIVASVR